MFTGNEKPTTSNVGIIYIPFLFNQPTYHKQLTEWYIKKAALNW